MLQDYREKEFSAKDAKLLNPLQLALIGDAVYELYIRNYILANNISLSAHKIHVKAIGYVKAKNQSAIMHSLEEELTEEESYIFKRGTVPKNADVRDYRMATGFEALVGYLHLIGDYERLNYILSKAVTIDISK